MLSQDASQLKVLIAVLRSDTKMKDETRRQMIILALNIFASDDPNAALTLLTEGKGMLDLGKEGTYLMTDSLVNWASSDPDGALEWFLKNGEKHPNLDTDDIKLKLLKGVASNSISLGFSLLGDLKFENPNAALTGLAESAGSPAERTEFLKLYREYSKAGEGKSDPKSDYMFTMSAFARNISAAGFEEGNRWMEDSDLSKDERNDLAYGIIQAAQNSEKGLWIEWMGENFSGKDREQKIYNAIQDWTEMDFRAAGEWLVKSPDSTAKEIAVAAYARTVAPHDPKVAAQWAITLPSGEIRNQTISNVYERWLKDGTANTAERDAFMAENPAK